MVCLGLKPGAAGWKAQTNPLSYGGTPRFAYLTIYVLSRAPVFTLELVRYCYDSVAKSTTYVQCTFFNVQWFNSRQT